MSQPEDVLIQEPGSIAPEMNPENEEGNNSQDEKESGGIYEDIDPQEDLSNVGEEPEDYSGDDDIDKVKDDEGVMEQAEENEENAQEDEGYTNATMVKEIEEKEKELLEAKKQWQMTGEVQATDRPINSLVEENLDFQLATKLPIAHTVMLDKN